jgi:hypothetical protein
MDAEAADYGGGTSFVGGLASASVLDALVVGSDYNAYPYNHLLASYTVD